MPEKGARAGRPEEKEDGELKWLLSLIDFPVPTNRKLLKPPGSCQPWTNSSFQLYILSQDVCDVATSELVTLLTDKCHHCVGNTEVGNPGIHHNLRIIQDHPQIVYSVSALECGAVTFLGDTLSWNIWFTWSSSLKTILLILNNTGMYDRASQKLWALRGQGGVAGSK